MQLVAENLWVLRYPLSLLGTDSGRVTTVIRLRTGDLIIHSTAPFTPSDASAIAQLGQLSWLVDATLMHDTFARPGHAMFPGLPYLTPEGFGRGVGIPTQLLLPAPTAWEGELDVLKLEGMPKIQEHIFLHRPSRTLIVADMVFNFGPEGTLWERFLRRYGADLKNYPGMSRFFRMMIKDPAAFHESIRQLMDWDFDRIIVGHGDIIETEGKRKLREALAQRGF